MARIPGLGHLLVGQPEVAERLQRALNLKGDLPQNTEGEYGLSVTAEDLTAPEFYYLRRAMQFQSGLSIAAVAAQLSISILAPLAGSPRTVLTVIEKVLLSNPGVAQITVQMGFARTVGFVQVQTILNLLDDRQRAIGATSTAFNQHNFFNNAASPPIDRPIFISLAPGASFCVEGPWISTFKDELGFVVNAAQLNVPLGVAMLWRERPILPSEL